MDQAPRRPDGFSGGSNRIRRQGDGWAGRQLAARVPQDAQVREAAPRSWPNAPAVRAVLQLWLKLDQN